jgi:hypothetical protein
MTFNSFVRRIGACRKCMREAFLAAAIAWAACVGFAIFGATLRQPLILPLAVGAALLATMNWLLHLVVFSARIASGSRAMPASKATNSAPERRSFLVGFTTTFAGIALATIFPASSAAQDVYYLCNTTFCNGNTCCPSSYRYLNHCDCQCYESSDFDCGSYSYCNDDCS